MGVVQVPREEYDRLVAKVGSYFGQLEETTENLAAATKLAENFDYINIARTAEVASLRGEVDGLKEELSKAKAGSNSNIGVSMGKHTATVESEQAVARVYELLDENRRLRTEMADNEKQQAQTATAYRREIQQLRALGSRNTFKVGDGEILARWKQLSFSIRNFIQNFPLQVLPRVTSKHITRYSRLTPNAGPLLTSPLFAYVLFEAMTWSFLIRGVFGPSSTLWADMRGKGFAWACEEIEADLDENDATLREFHEWRARGVSYYSRTYAPQQIVVAKLATFMMRYIDHTSKPDSADVEAAVDIIQQAAELDLILRKSKFSFVVSPVNPYLEEQPGNFGFPFDSREMDLKDTVNFSARSQTSEHPTVDLIVSPGLWKQGSSDGHNYNQVSRLVKPLVVCGLPGSEELAPATAGLAEDVHQETALETSTNRKPPDVRLGDHEDFDSQEDTTCEEVDQILAIEREMKRED